MDSVARHLKEPPRASGDRLVELMRESAAYVLANDDGFYTRKEIWQARQFLRETEPMPEGWEGKLPELR